jgi:alpha-galactosidase
VGNGGMSQEEYRARFSMWAILSSPLLAGNDLAHMTSDTKEILLNKEVIAIDRGSMGIPARRVKKSGDLEVWSKQLSDGSRAVALLNRSEKSATITADWQDFGHPGSLHR